MFGWMKMIWCDRYWAARCEVKCVVESGIYAHFVVRYGMRS